MDEVESAAMRAFVGTWADAQYFRGRYQKHSAWVLYGAITITQRLIGERRGLWLAQQCRALGVPPKDVAARREWVDRQIRPLWMRMPNEADVEEFG